MKLTAPSGRDDLEVVRAAEFESLGILIHNRPKQLGFMEDAKYVPKLLAGSNMACVITTPELASVMPEVITVPLTFVATVAAICHTGDYPMAVHLQEAYADLGHHVGDFPCSEQLANEVLSLPMFAKLSSRDIQQVAEAIKARAHKES